VDSGVILGAVDESVVDGALLVAVEGLAGYAIVQLCDYVAYMNLRRGILGVLEDLRGTVCVMWRLWKSGERADKGD